MARGRNSRLKKSHTEVEYTPEQIQELKRCLDDPIYFMKKYVYIKHPVEGQILFSLFDYQEVMVRNFQNNRFCINLLPRQVGKTEVISAYLLWFAIFNTDKTILVTSNKSDGAKEIIGKIQNAYEELPHWLKPGIDETSWNKHTCTFDNKSRIISTTTAEDTGRGLAVSLLYCDEFAFVKDHIQEKFWDSIYPTLSTGGSCIISSTPNGDINKFAELWRAAELNAPGNKFVPFTVAWNARPGRDEAFKAAAIAALGLQKWEQEYECQFISSDHTLINTKLISAIEKTLTGFQPAFTLPHADKFQAFYKKINRDSTYLVGVDPGTGTGKDNSVIEVYEFPSMEQVMEFSDNTVSHVELYAYLKKILLFLEHFAKEVYFSVENNGVGQGVIALYEADDNAPKKASFISDDGRNKLGMVTTDKNKMEACLLLKSMFESNTMKFYSMDLLKELKNYKRSKGSYEAKIGATDDRISASLIVLKMLKEISTYDGRAYHTLYTANLGDGADAWVQIANGQNRLRSREPDYEDYDDNEVPLPGGIL